MKKENEFKFTYSTTFIACKSETKSYIGFLFLSMQAHSAIKFSEFSLIDINNSAFFRTQNKSEMKERIFALVSMILFVLYGFYAH